jgi:hypothetical protein
VPSFYERYLAGECEQVWDELYLLGADVRKPDYFTDAVGVAQETMRRVRLNCEMLIHRLEQFGWRFGYEWTGKWAAEDVAEQPPLLGEPTSTAILDNIEANSGLLPISLRSFYEVVGAVNFVGTPFYRPGWPRIEDGLDPLYVAGVDQAFGHQHFEWDENTDSVRAIDTGDALVPPWRGEVEVAPDFLHKYFISGVGSEYIRIPSAGADAPLMFQDGPLKVQGHDLTLVRELRYALQGGGFLAFMPGSQWNTRPSADLAYLTDGLRPI